ncbi:acyloxyacyl hydrolase [Ruegeria sp. 2012CJ41-6]|uniref:Acyloxyacyl hydrolase n=1 Tax=Ruegeria spongiae TaxID=2942209 RepID=A0ABT0Q0H9_9RHOB|nr:acyloxyacyl hydrolase [Ruegeria spongiae]MCL6283375.1 acyloxyacyl hydrolase [Ruegeria spongiae]
MNTAYTPRFLAWLIITFFLVFRSASAAEWVVGFGADDLFDSDGDPAVAGLVEVHTNPFLDRPRFNLTGMATLLVDSERDVFAGVGVHSVWSFPNSRFFLEGSFAAGGFNQGGDSPPRKETDSFLYRTSIGFGRHLSEISRLSLTLDHLFNNDFKNYEPGSESILLRYSRGF